jgi:hypothetical protein
LKPRINKINRINKERERATKDREPSRARSLRVSGGTAGAKNSESQANQETERTVSARSRAKGTAASENLRSDI